MKSTHLRKKKKQNKIKLQNNKREIICTYLCECWWFLACLQAPPPAVDLGYLKNPAADGRVRVHVSRAALLMQRSSDGATELSTDQGSLLSRDQGTLAPLGTTGSSPPPAPPFVRPPVLDDILRVSLDPVSPIIAAFYFILFLQFFLWSCLSADYP
jgi:hypothetical protein